MSTVIPVTALVQTSALRADFLLYDAVQRRKQLGWNIRGLIAVPAAGDSPDHPEEKSMDQVENLHTGERHTILQSRGRDARGCRLNPYALNQAGDELRHALEAEPDLVVINRFGITEAEGGGFCSELISLLSAEIPVLVVVTERYLDSWRHFIGGSDYELPCCPQALDAWLDSLPLKTNSA